MRAFFFGCSNNDAGHFMFRPGMRSHYVRGGTHRWDPLPWDKIDGALAPKLRNGQAEGVAALHHKDGWTAIAFWDRSVDTRGGSNAAFFFEATLDFDQAVAAARQHFPEVVDRFGFEIRPVMRYRTRDESVQEVAVRVDLETDTIRLVLNTYEQVLSQSIPDGART